MHRVLDVEPTTPTSSMLAVTVLKALTVTVCGHVVMLPQWSVAFHVIVVVPVGNGNASGWLSLRVAVIVGDGSQPSIAVAVPTLMVAVQPPASAFWVMSGGHIIDGATVSTMVKVRVDEEAGLPHASEAVQCAVTTCVVPLQVGTSLSST